MKSAGAQLASTEMILFELLRTAADHKAKDIFKIVKEEGSEFLNITFSPPKELPNY